MWCPPSPILFPCTTLFRSRELVSLVPVLPPAGTGRAVRGGAIGGAAAGDPSGADRLHRRGRGDRGRRRTRMGRWVRSEEHTSELQSRENLVCRLLLEKKKL